MSARILWRLWVVLLAVSMAAIVLWPPPEPRPIAELSPVPPPELPLLPSLANNEQDLRLLNESPLFGAPQRKDEKTASTENITSAWSLVGTAMVDGRGIAVIRFEAGDKKPQELGKGDTMPDGKTIRAIDREGIFVGKEEEASSRITVLDPPVPAIPQ